MHLSVISTHSVDFIKHEEKYNQFLQLVESSDSPAAVNMGHEPPAGLVYLLKGQHRWNKDSGEIALLHNDDTNSIVGISGVEHSTLLPELGSGGNRCWLLPDYRKKNEVTRFLLKRNLEWCVEHDKKGMLLSFNNYNKLLYDAVVKINKGRAAAIGTVWSNWWKDCIPLPRQIMLFNTPQWAVLKPLGNNAEMSKIVKKLDSTYGI
jgi:hypothetical protein